MLACRAVFDEPTRLIRPWEPLYDAVGTGMWGFTTAAFRIRLLTPGFRMGEGVVFVATHRAETDVPLICGQCFFNGGMWRYRQLRLHFAAREDLFDRGFFAGFPPDLSLRVRRLLYPICAGPYLPRVRVNPLPYPGADVLRVGRALQELPGETELAAVLPGELVESFAARAREARLEAPRVAREALRGEFADLLWTMLPRDRLDAPLLEEVWARRRARAAEEVRNVVELVRSGAPTLFFPEGRPSPDGAIGPLRAGLAMLVRRGEPQALRAISIAYDRLTCGRPYAFLAVGDPFLPEGQSVDAEVLTALRATLPLTAGQVVATELCSAAAGGSERLQLATLDAAFTSAWEEARAQDRPAEPAWRDRASRRAGLADALRFLGREGLARADGPRALALDPARVLGDARITFTAREFASAREGSHASL
jgi:1-acyl-sn-glycerol-3-phosphate acyltransferase